MTTIKARVREVEARARKAKVATKTEAGLRRVYGKKPAAPVVDQAAAVRATAGHLIDVCHLMMSDGSVRLPYPGFLEAIVDLRRALTQW